MEVERPAASGPSRRLFWGVLATALFLRLAGFGLALVRDHDCMLEPDSLTYEQPALSLLEHVRFSRAPETPDVPELQRTPGYPVFIAAVYALAGPNRIALCLVQILLSLIPLAVVYTLAQRLWNERAALWGTLFLALDPMSLVSCGLMLTETLFTALLLLALLVGASLAGENRREYARALLFGLLLAAATLVRPLAYYLIAPVVVWAVGVKYAAGGSWRRAWALGAALLLPWIVLVGGWHVRNYRVAGSAEFSFIKNIDLLQYRAAAVVALEKGIRLEEAQRQLLSQLPDTGGEAERSAVYGRAAREILLGHPWLTVRVSLAGALRLFAGPGLASVREYFSIPADTRAFRLGYPAFALAYLAVVYILSLLSLRRWCRERAAWPVHLLLCGALFYFVAVSSGPETYARFRVPLMPILALYAGSGIAGRKG